MLGELVPVGGGDTIPLLKPRLIVGRREGCDIVLRFPNVSGQHCELSVQQGYWFVRDLNSSNGIKVNGARVTDHRLSPGDTLSVAKHEFNIYYAPADLGAVGPPPDKEASGAIFGKSLLERAGLSKPKQIKELERADDDQHARHDVLNDNPQQLRPKKDANKPV